mmetsp:Transcript_53308/g.149690  ORF Transcript_53308/g.149690 Transcript_53308/m.149690 type:complete len:265 (+) Transcript_53308:211-1005(+)
MARHGDATPLNAHLPGTPFTAASFSASSAAISSHMAWLSFKYDSKRSAPILPSTWLIGRQAGTITKLINPCWLFASAGALLRSQSGAGVKPSFFSWSPWAKNSSWTKTDQCLWSLRDLKGWPMSARWRRWHSSFNLSMSWQLVCTATSEAMSSHTRLCCAMSVASNMSTMRPFNVSKGGLGRLCCRIGAPMSCMSAKAEAAWKCSSTDLSRYRTASACSVFTRKSFPVPGCAMSCTAAVSATTSKSKSLKKPFMWSCAASCDQI